MPRIYPLSWTLCSIAAALGAQAPSETPPTVAKSAVDVWDGSPQSGQVSPNSPVDFELTLPEDACFLRLDATGAQRQHVTLSVYLDAEDHGDGSWYSLESGPAPWLVYQNFGESLFDRDTVIVRVASATGAPVGFELEAQVVRAQASLKLEFGKRVLGAIGESGGHRQTFRIDVPEDVGQVRFDLTGSERDLDLFVSRGSPCVDLEDANAQTESYSNTEILTVPMDDPGDGQMSRTLFATVYDPNRECEMEPFELYASAGPGAPAALQRAPDMPLPKEPSERTIAAIVELRTPDNWGSGVFVGQGVILTAKHLFEDLGEDEVTVAVTVDPRRYPVEFFRGRVVETHPSYDLALVKVEGNAHGAPLPADFEYPTVTVDFDREPRIGEHVSTIGYPAIGGITSRRAITWSRGALAGFDPDPFGEGLKTDAVIAQGNSGGALVDDQLRLLGITTSAIEENDGSDELGYATPVQLVPRAWRQRWFR